MKIKIYPCKDYTNPSNCGIAKGLKKKLIVPFIGVGPNRWSGLFLGFIPVWGKISDEADDIAMESDKEGFKPVKVKIGLFN
jgi:hypothetical protein